jgi:hypothetical protein
MQEGRLFYGVGPVPARYPVTFWRKGPVGVCMWTRCRSRWLSRAGLPLVLEGPPVDLQPVGVRASPGFACAGEWQA